MSNTKIQKVLLVQAGTTSATYPFRSHPLGLMYVASSLRKKIPDIDVRIIDMKVNGMSPEVISEVCLRENIDLAGIGGFSIHADIIKKTAKAIRSRNPDVFLVAGGPHASCHSESLLESMLFNAVVSGEGEHVLPDIISAIETRYEMTAIPGVSILVGDMASATPPKPIADPDSLPYPAWDLIDSPLYSRYSSFSILGRRRYMSLFTSRGCPYGCIYCHHIFGRKYRPRSVEGIIGEIREIIGRFGIRDFDILDDVFNFDRERVKEFCEQLLSLGPPMMLAFPNGLRSDLLDEETLGIMRRAGTRYISFAIESATPRLQSIMKKNLDIEKSARAIRIASKLGIFCNGFFMLGFPTETEEEISETGRFATRSPLHTAHFLKVTPFEGTEIFRMMTDAMRKKASSMPDVFKYYDRSFNLSSVDNDRFNTLMASIHRRFYMNPLRLLRMIAAHPRPFNLLHFGLFAVRRILFASSKGS